MTKIKSELCRHSLLIQSDMIAQKVGIAVLWSIRPDIREQDSVHELIAGLLRPSFIDGIDHHQFLKPGQCQNRIPKIVPAIYCATFSKLVARHEKSPDF
jgi:hypothetical protein